MTGHPLPEPDDREPESPWDIYPGGMRDGEPTDDEIYGG